MRYLALLIVLLVAGCCEDCPYKKYRLSSGKIVECREFRTYTGECGLSLQDCRDGNTYRCQTNVEEINAPADKPELR